MRRIRDLVPTIAVRPACAVTLALTAALLLALAGVADAGLAHSRPLRTGQTTCWNHSGFVISCVGTGQDGESRRGVARAYIDNGDGTITDQKTALIWEKLSDDTSIHDKDNMYTWDEAFTVKIASLNSGGGFAGHTDWRLPNKNELASIVDAQAFGPAVLPTFNTACVPACTVLTCSCTVAFSSYWSSSSYAFNPALGWTVMFFGGIVSTDDKSKNLFVRAVRGGT